MCAFSEGALFLVTWPRFHCANYVIVVFEHFQHSASCVVARRDVNLEEPYQDEDSGAQSNKCLRFPTIGFETCRCGHCRARDKKLIFFIPFSPLTPVITITANALPLPRETSGQWSACAVPIRTNKLMGALQHVWFGCGGRTLRLRRSCIPVSPLS